MRIVSLLPSATEILCALGLEANLVGRSHECDFPKQITKLPILTRPRLDPKAASGQIHQKVVDLVSGGLSVYELDTEKLAALKPDLIVTQHQCEVCAISLDEVTQALQTLTLRKTQICSLSADSLATLYADVQKVGEFSKKASRACGLVEQMKTGLAQIQQTARKHAPPSALCLEWLDPPMVAGCWIPELVSIAGATPLIVSKPGEFLTTDWKTLSQTDADHLCLLPCGFPISQTREELSKLPKTHPLFQLKSVKQAQATIYDGNAFFNRPGPRILDSAEMLAATFHPELFPSFVHTHHDDFRKL